LPSYVDDVEEYANLAAFPGTGETGKIYVALDTNKTYRWSGSVYIQITSGAVDSVNGETGVVVLNADHIDDSATTNKFASAAQLAKVDHISVSQAVDLDTIETDSGLNNAHRALTSGNPHSVTKAEVGLGSVDNLQQMPLSYLDTDDTLSADSDTKVPSQQAVKAYVDGQVGGSAVVAGNEVITLSAQNITDGYVELAAEARAGSLHVIPVGGPTQEISVDYSLSVPGAVTRVTFAGDLLANAAAGKKIMFKYLVA
jgi:hypothetical protein